MVGTKGLNKKADIVFAKYIKNRDKVCIKCGTLDYLQCAHLYSRSYKQIRHNPDNAVALCRGDHVYFTHHPIEWTDFIESKFPGRWRALRKKALDYHKKIDYKEIILNLSAPSSD